MLILIKNNIPNNFIKEVKNFLNEKKLNCTIVNSADYTIIAIDGIVSDEIIDQLHCYPFIDRIINLKKEYKLVLQEGIISKGINLKGTSIKSGKLTIIAGPCSVESREQIIEIAQFLRDNEVDVLRGGAFKPRTSPYSFQGLGIKGLEYLAEAGSITGIPVISEVLSPEDIDIVSQYVDILQIGARNMYNYPLLKKAGKQNKPILLKRGLMAKINEFLLSAEYILCEGNNKIILCERGIRTFEVETRNTLDISAIPILKRLTSLPIFADPSHASGHSNLVGPLAKACIAAGADGLIIEVHKNPRHAKTDGFQSIDFKSFKKLLSELKTLYSVIKEFN